MYMTNSSMVHVKIFYRAADKILKLMDENFKGAKNIKPIGFWNLPSIAGVQIKKWSVSITNCPRFNQGYTKNSFALGFALWKWLFVLDFPL